MSAPEFEVHQEEDVVPSGRLVRIAVASIVIGAVGVVAAGALLVASAGALKGNMAGPSGPEPARPEISNIEQTPIWDTHAAEDLQRSQQRSLETWGWADRDAGIARIPIERAMDLVTRGQR
ncbi:MAG TPA: hypothetical protein VGL81_03975 [Polyangiaceae bacterium]|jgi:hypothetical protein